MSKLTSLPISEMIRRSVKEESVDFQDNEKEEDAFNAWTLPSLWRIVIGKEKDDSIENITDVDVLTSEVKKRTCRSVLARLLDFVLSCIERLLFFFGCTESSRAVSFLISTLIF